MATTATRLDRRMYALMNNPAAKPLHATAARRRFAVGAHIALTAAQLGLLLTAYLGEQRWPAFAVLALLLPWCLATGAINAATRGLLELSSRVLDERQLAERDRVRALAQRVTTVLLAVGALAAAAIGWFGDTEGGGAGGDVRIGALVALVLAGVLVVHWLMPLWVAGLMVRSEPADEDGDE
ncbi:hypothetical protein OG883_02845 [Streptomyces sp. NBC_01142]|uniref:hypothetical protein n=1 Tax=Streptomyces sp. NBC_01142 TaxID=2975865 RepID=UPI002257F6B7|nr:hypothetical protein [Streptomyces sp. NBC_01142]MCX4818856.1 hypothetical protein [Streptomyces sp. NBC_01142]